MRQDEKGYFYFFDRIGNTFRRKGENVATSEVGCFRWRIGTRRRSPILRPRKRFAQLPAKYHLG
jgi:hypothetical protein